MLLHVWQNSLPVSSAAIRVATGTSEKTQMLVYSRKCSHRQHVDKVKTELSAKCCTMFLACVDSEEEKSLCQHGHNKPCSEQQCRSARCCVLCVSAHLNKASPLLTLGVDEAVKSTSACLLHSLVAPQVLLVIFCFFHDRPNSLYFDHRTGMGSDPWWVI